MILNSLEDELKMFIFEAILLKYERICYIMVHEREKMNKF